MAYEEATSIEKAVTQYLNNECTIQKQTWRRLFACAMFVMGVRHLFINRNFDHHIALANGVDDIHALDDAAKNGVLAIKVGLGAMSNKELAAIGIRASVGHGDDPRLVGERIAAYLIGKLIAGATRASAGRIAALDHKVADHAMELEAIVETLLGEEDKVVDRHRGGLGVEFEFDKAFGRIHRDLIGLGGINLHLRWVAPLVGHGCTPSVCISVP